jgi:tRNA modification GTPase
MRSPLDTVAAIATPSGRGGIGVVRISGEGVPALVEALIGRPLSPRMATLATFRAANGDVLDQGLALYFPAPHSYTGEHVLELQGHGGPAVMRLLLERCVELGAELAAPGEFTQRAFLNGKLDLAQAEGVADLIEAATATAARAAARSLSGAFSRAIRHEVEALVELRMLTEATLDFPDEDIDFLRRADAVGRVARIREALTDIDSRARRGALLRDGLTMVIVGQPNVGKSSLLNQLAGDDVAIVTPLAGTTRDTVRNEIELAGVPVTVVDTAGLRPTDDPIETLGIERTWSAVAHADLVLVMVDARDCVEEVSPTDAAILRELPATLARIVVHNKIDLTDGVAREELRAPPPPQERSRHHVWLSAKTGAGVALLRQAMLAAVGRHEDPEGSFLARTRHLAALDAAGGRLAAAAGHIESAAPPLELFAEELREAQTALSAISGEFTADDLLGEIFSRFCIGK